MTITDDRALTLLREHFVEPQGWDWCSDYGEPGYNHDGDQQVVVLGDYWCRCKKIAGTHAYDAHHPLLWARFEEIASFEWRDEWLSDYEVDKCYRTQGDSYGWTPSAVYDDGGDIVSNESDIEHVIEYGIGWRSQYGGDDHPRALYRTLVSISALEEAGFVRWPDDDTFYESGWHPGQDDDPMKLVELIRTERGDDEQILIYVTGQGQFDTRWVVLTRTDPNKEES